jgi:hypothetical protein
LVLSNKLDGEEANRKTAEDLFKATYEVFRALELSKRDANDTIETEENLADKLVKYKKYAHAEAIYEKAISNSKKLLGDQNPTTKRLRQKLRTLKEDPASQKK